MNKTVENILATGAVVITSPLWIPYKFTKELIVSITKNDNHETIQTQKNKSNNKKDESNTSSEEEDKMKENEFETLELINPSRIKQMDLFYPKQIESLMTDIGNCLKEQEYEAFQNAMKEEELVEGFIALFYGAPGTGKTESVYQIAKMCNRKIFKVDMAEIVSMWIGETGHRVRQTFKKYRKFCSQVKKDHSPIPILLLNEADALLGKRHSFNSTSNPISVQNNNQVQGILLEEFENNKGIIILTTNMASNLDSAFESRIFEKIHFTIPDEITREKIWKSKIPELREEQIKVLARDFKFSGRDINQVVRNIKKKKVLSERKQLPKFETIYKICKNVKIVK